MTFGKTLPRLIFTSILALAGLGLLNACAHVKVYERGALADPIMSFNTVDDMPTSVESSVFYVNFNEHTLVYAGGVSGSSGGGGCPFCK